MHCETIPPIQVVGGSIQICPWREVLPDGRIQPIPGEGVRAWPLVSAAPPLEHPSTMWFPLLDELRISEGAKMPNGVRKPVMLHPGYLAHLDLLHAPNFLHSGGCVYYGATRFIPTEEPDNWLTTCMLLGLDCSRGIEPAVAISNINQFVAVGKKNYRAFCAAMDRDLAAVQAASPCGGRLVLPHIPNGNRTVTNIMSGRGWRITQHVPLPYYVNGQPAACMIGEWGDPMVPLDRALSLYQASGAVYSAASAHGPLGLAAPPDAYAGPGLVQMAPGCKLGDTLEKAEAACGVPWHYRDGHGLPYFGHYNPAALDSNGERDENPHTHGGLLVQVNPTRKVDMLFLDEFTRNYS